MLCSSPLRKCVGWRRRLLSRKERSQARRRGGGMRGEPETKSWRRNRGEEELVVVNGSTI
jgi:hypothetical protein